MGKASLGRVSGDNDDETTEAHRALSSCRRALYKLRQKPPACYSHRCCIFFTPPCFIQTPSDTFCLLQSSLLQKYFFLMPHATVLHTNSVRYHLLVTVILAAKILLPHGTLPDTILEMHLILIQILNQLPSSICFMAKMRTPFC